MVKKTAKPAKIVILFLVLKAKIQKEISYYNHSMQEMIMKKDHRTSSQRPDATGNKIKITGKKDSAYNQKHVGTEHLKRGFEDNMRFEHERISQFAIPAFMINM